MRCFLKLCLLLLPLYLTFDASASPDKSEVEKFISFGGDPNGTVPILWYYDEESSKSLGAKKKHFDLHCIFHDLYFYPDGSIAFGPDQEIPSDCRYSSQNSAINFRWSVVNDKQRGVIEFVAQQDEAGCRFKIDPRSMAKSVLVLTTRCRQLNYKNFQLRFRQNEEN